ncbi:hypothetical protein C8J57DRAFT_1234101 [Mycena rebaudengoi]|nr:hypothetical protein C8J57DRAFT_1234101 [Mycena rebaudengoi]
MGKVQFSGYVKDPVEVTGCEDPPPKSTVCIVDRVFILLEIYKKGSITQDAGQTVTGQPFGGTSGYNLVGPDHKPKAQVYGRRDPPPRQNSPESTSQQKAVSACETTKSGSSASEEEPQPTIEPVSWPEKGVYMAIDADH